LTWAIVGILVAAFLGWQLFFRQRSKGNQGNQRTATRLLDKLS
jgi:hypothetical protein